MRHLVDLVGMDLKWEQPSAIKMEYALYPGESDELVATLKFRSSFGSLATAESADGCWTFKRVGFFQTRITVRSCASDAEIASFRNNTWTSGGVLELPDGRSYPASTNFWKTKIEFLSSSEEPLVEYRKIGGFFHYSSYMTIHPAAAAITELPWMAILGWYLAILLQQDAAAAAATGA